MLAWGLGYFGMPQVLVRFLSIRSSEEIKKSRIIATTWCVISLACGVCIGLVGRAMMPTQFATQAAAENIFIVVSQALLPSFMCGIVVSGIFAASMSSSSSYMIIGASAVGENIFRGLLHRKATDRQVMMVARITLLVMFIFGIVVAALSFSTHVTTIPNYLVVNKLGLVNTCWALIIPKIAVAYNFFLVKQFCEQLPDSILEAARIDGARELHIFWKIAMPLLKPAWTTLAVFSFVSNWNDYFSPLIFIQSNALKTMPLALQTMSGGAGVVARAGTVGAATFLTTLPSILVFAIMRGKVMETMSYSGIKS